MLKINYNKLSEGDFGFKDLDDIYYLIDTNLYYLLTHNKNYTKKQYEYLQQIADFFSAIDII